jgi:EAL domain-containing protein (putative c-di-GMP-specific phosphodiesterase class I)
VLVAALAEPVRALGVEVKVGPAVGIGMFPRDGTDLDTLLGAADSAACRARESGRGAVAMQSPEFGRRAALRQRLRHQFGEGAARSLTLVYQPVVALSDGMMVGAECLVRWRDEEFGDIPAEEIVQVAEDCGLMIELGEWVLREACRTRKVLRGLGIDVPPFSINAAGTYLESPSCVDRLLATLVESGVAAAEIEVEITETSLFATSEVGRENLRSLREAGVRVALDNFGIGYSSLSHLRELPIHRLNIDRSFTAHCMHDARTLTILKAVIEMARALGIGVTAEGIETQAQQTWMQHLGCDAAQGFLFAPPMPADEFLRIFIDRRRSDRQRGLMH